MLGGRDFDVALMRHFNAFIVREKGDRYDVFPSAAAFREVVLSGEDRIFQRRWTLHQAARNLKEQLARRDTARYTTTTNRFKSRKKSFST
jgi:hypothetical protein